MYSLAVWSEAQLILILRAVCGVLRDAFLDDAFQCDPPLEAAYQLLPRYDFLHRALSSRRAVKRLAKFVHEVLTLFDAFERYIPAAGSERSIHRITSNWARRKFQSSAWSLFFPLPRKRRFMEKRLDGKLGPLSPCPSLLLARRTSTVNSTSPSVAPTRPSLNIFPAVFAKHLGSGAGGVVFLSTDSPNVVKVFKDKRTAHHEADLLTMCHDDLWLRAPKFHGLYSDGHNLAVVMSYVGTPLRDNFSAPDAQKREIVDILKSLHRSGIHHHDVGPSHSLSPSTSLSRQISGCPDVEVIDALQQCLGGEECMSNGSWNI
ncbi:hypothetical protein B0H16DRAFT_1479652 [Mycena metata]|uniref:Protein kinase domain-containing protein n=1 Tax=Mycena metata TaxID=1033252 RepID=A0AAD7H4J8_9AGAR|nr:hypothetical protein B0H16DRAFT_1479652 [Mycena metata]